MATPIAKPPALKLLAGRGPGVDSGGRKVATGPEFEPEVPDAPMWLSEEARAEWNRVVPDLAKLDLLRRVDRAALTSYVLAWDRLVKATQQVQKEGPVAKNDLTGRVQRHPALTTAENASRELRAWAAEFGLTPSSVARLPSKAADAKQQTNPFATTG